MRVRAAACCCAGALHARIAALEAQNSALLEHSRRAGGIGATIAGAIGAIGGVGGVGGLGGGGGGASCGACSVVGACCAIGGAAAGSGAASCGGEAGGDFDEAGRRVRQRVDGYVDGGGPEGMIGVDAFDGSSQQQLPSALLHPPGQDTAIPAAVSAVAVDASAASAVSSVLRAAHHQVPAGGQVVYVIPPSDEAVQNIVSAAEAAVLLCQHVRRCATRRSRPHVAAAGEA